MSVRKIRPIVVLYAVVAVLGIRAAWWVTSSECGWRPHLVEWQRTAARMLGFSARSLGERDPEEQAKYWLEQIQQIPEIQTNSQLALGAAWMLDSPQTGFLHQHLVIEDDMRFLPASWRRSLNYEEITRQNQLFEDLCRDDCVSLAETAVRLDPESVTPRRSLALLQIYDPWFDSQKPMRRSDWLQVFDQSAAVDPDNALYDFLAAQMLWDSSATVKATLNGDEVTVTDPERYELGNARFLAGLTKPRFEFGETGLADVYALLEETPIPRTEHGLAAKSRQIFSRPLNMLFSLQRWQSRRIWTAERDGRIELAKEEAERLLRIPTQLDASENFPGAGHAELILRKIALASLIKLAKDHPDAFELDEVAEIARRYNESRIDSAVWQEIERRTVTAEPTSVLRAAWGRLAERIPKEQHALTSALLAAVPGISLMFVLPSLSLACVVFLFSHICGKRTEIAVQQFRWWQHLIVWSIPISLSVLLLGMIPESVFSRVMRRVIFIGLVWCFLGGLFLIVLAVIKNWFALTARDTAALTSIALMLIVGVLWPGTIWDFTVSVVLLLPPFLLILTVLGIGVCCWKLCCRVRSFARDPDSSTRRKLLSAGSILVVSSMTVLAGGRLLQTSDHPAGPNWMRRELGDLMSAMPVHLMMGFDEATWPSVFFRWWISRGPLLVPLFAVLILSLWMMIRRSVQTPGGLREIVRCHKRQEIRVWGNAVVRSCLIAALIFLIPYFAATPTIAAMMDASYRYHHVWLAEPEELREQIEQLKTEIRADAALMTRFQREIDALDRQLAAQEAERESLRLEETDAENRNEDSGGENSLQNAPELDEASTNQ